VRGIRLGELLLAVEREAQQAESLRVSRVGLKLRTKRTLGRREILALECGGGRAKGRANR
jgi:hypothetical protein